MCGLFGTIRPHQYPQDLRTIAATALIDLGYLAEERGVDSAGIAVVRIRHRPSVCSRTAGLVCGRGDRARLCRVAMPAESTPRSSAR